MNVTQVKKLKQIPGFSTNNVGLSRDYMKQKFEQLAKEVEFETGMALTLDGNLSYDFNNVNMKFNLFKSNGTSKVKLEWDSNCYKFNLNESDFGKKFKSNGETFEIVGCKTRRVKRPIIARNVVTKQDFVFPVSLVVLN